MFYIANIIINLKHKHLLVLKQVKRIRLPKILKLCSHFHQNIEINQGIKTYSVLLFLFVEDVRIGNENDNDTN